MVNDNKSYRLEQVQAYAPTSDSYVPVPRVEEVEEPEAPEAPVPPS